MMNTRQFSKMMALLLILALGACGGGGGGVAGTSGGGIGGTGLSTSGTIDGFGSIFVNGIEIETGDATIILDGEAGDESVLGLGMVVFVSGTLNADGVTGTADSVIFDDEVQGPVASIILGPDGDTQTLSVLGVQVLVDRTATVFDGVDFDTLEVDDLVEVSGFVQESGELRATRVEKKQDFVPGVSEIELKGVIENLSGSEFNLGSFTVDYSTADLSGVPTGTLEEGMFVEVKGTLEGNRISAEEIEEEDGISDKLNEGDEVSLQGTISAYASDADFLVSGTPVDASAASFSPQTLSLADGLEVEVQGRWNGSVLLADEVDLRSGGGGGDGTGGVEIHAAVASVSSAGSSITLQLFGGTVEVTVDSQTQMEDKTGVVDPLTLDDINPGDFLMLQGIRDGDTIRVDRLDRDDVDDDRLEGPLDSFVADTSVTVLGITYSTPGASFEDALDQPISESDFYNALQVGDQIKVQDDVVADGIADEVEFED